MGLGLLRLGQFCLFDDGYGGVFLVYFKAYWNTGLDPAESTFRLGLANSVASLTIVLAPFLGAIADCMSRRKVMLFVFCMSRLVDDRRVVPGRRG